MDLAVGVIIGGAFSKLVDSLVKDILTPILTPLTGTVDFATLKVGPFGIGSFVNNVVQFVIVAFALFLIIKAYNRFQKPADAPIDLAAENVEQNREMIALLRTLAERKPL